jgi:FHS family glucose/mannose:H+ symporter-like MFS transporter
VTDSIGSLFFSASSLFGIIGAALSHWLLTKVGELKGLRLSIITFAVGLFIMAAAGSFPGLIFGVIFFGFSMGLMGVIQNILIVNEVPPGPLKAQMISGLHSMYAASSLLAPLIVSGISIFSVGSAIWRNSFIVTGVLCLLVLMLTFFNLKMDPPPIPMAESPPLFSSDRKGHIYFGVILSSYVLAEILVSSRLALFIRRESGGGFADANFYTALFFVFLFLSRFLFAVWSPRVPIQVQLKASLGLSFISILLGLWLHPFGLAFSAFFMGPFYPLMILEMSHRFPKSMQKAVAWAVSLSSVFIVGMHVLVGFASESYGLKIAFLLGPFFLLAAFILLEVHEKVFRRL